MDANEKIRIMQLVQKGTITPEEALQLLDGMDRKQNDRQPSNAATNTESPKWARVLITDMDTGRVSVNIRMPLGLIHAGRMMGARFSPSVKGIDVDQLFQKANLDERGRVVEVFDEDDREHVEIFVE